MKSGRLPPQRLKDVSGLDLSGHHVRICAYVDGQTALPPTDILPILDDLLEFFKISLNVVRGEAARDKTSIEDTVEWFSRELHQLERDSRDGESGGVYLIKGRHKLSWELQHVVSEGFRHEHDWPFDPHIGIAVDLALAKRPDSVFEFSKRIAQRFMANPRIWHALIDPGPRYLAPRFGDYGGCIGRPHRTWERHVEQCRWLDFVAGKRDRARGVFWGTMFGPAFANRLLDAGFERDLAWLKDACSLWQPNPTVLRDERTGSMAVLLDDDPVKFAKLREQADGPDVSDIELAAAIKCGGLMWHVMSRAGLI